MIKFELENINYDEYSNKIFNIIKDFTYSGKMSDWYYIDKCVSLDELSSIKKTAKYVNDEAELFIVVGIGGSFLGSKAIIDSLDKKTNVDIVFAGTTLSSNELSKIIQMVRDKKTVINVISKSGSTLETTITFNLLLEEMKKKYSKEELKSRIIITTDKDNSSLLDLQKELDCQLYYVPKNIGGRFSVLTPVGLLPCAVALVDIDLLLLGARDATENTDDVLQYTAIRDICYKKNKFIEAFTVYQPQLQTFNEWLKQLFAESQGKNKKGILPISIINSKDLHSLGQYLDDGMEIIFETVIYAHEKENIFVSGYNKTLDEINYITMRSVKEAHSHMVNNLIELDEITEYNLGYLIYFFEKVCMLGAYLLDVNYFDQDGVNNYKNVLKEKI